ncbi:ATP-dependent Clp protease adaptor ClpS [Mitsuaria sp. GD03876]|uniref:ATP-dependent Clp protease adaptor ClpS n=1 Tax=Mitsuaria sp. GD03876 TaxID=2975399 RepID=UPI002446F911|nr:ATP-dependent Clp protease adaptor ClpS [Mitsuaria sp. GD03876]MDH0867797.1 ATP-dependent Clp protease adaptor ClpS [Mitsuaria sp. GD03876]
MALLKLLQYRYRLCTIRGVPVFIGWSLPAGGLLVSLISRADVWHWPHYCIAYTALILVHEGGHLLAAKALRLQVFALDLHGLGGHCLLAMPRSVAGCALLYLSGMLAQLVAFAIALWVALPVWPSLYAGPHGFARAFAVTFVLVNAVVFFLSLIPMRPQPDAVSNDGRVLWELLLHVVAGRPHPAPTETIAAVAPQEAPIFPPETRLLDLPDFAPAGFRHGVEMLNDATTPMPFVLEMLGRHLDLNEHVALMTMIQIHNSGGALIPLGSARQARRIADAVSAASAAAGHGLVCRAVRA